MRTAHRSFNHGGREIKVAVLDSGLVFRERYQRRRLLLRWDEVFRFARKFYAGNLFDDSEIPNYQHETKINSGATGE